MSIKITREQIVKFPKTDLHVHLDGSIDAKTILELAKNKKIDLVKIGKESGLFNLSSASVDEIEEKIFKQEYQNLAEYLLPFEFVNCVLRNAENLEEAAYRVACDEFNEGVRYFELRFAPQKHWSTSFTWEDIIKAIDKGLKRAMNEYNSRPEIKSESEPPYKCGMILCAMRMIRPDMADYYYRLNELHTGVDLQELATMAAREIAHLAVNSMKKGYLVVGFDLAGREDGYPARVHRDSFLYCYNYGLQATCHAGEAYGPESIMDAIKYCHVQRIGHGTKLFRWEEIKSKRTDGEELNDDEKRQYAHNIAERLAKARTTIEVCLKSNSQTTPTLRDLTNHPVKNILKYGLRVALSTDNRAISRVTVSDEYMTFIKLYDISGQTLKNLCIAGFKGAFYPSTYAEHRIYMRKAIDFFNECFNKYVGNYSYEEKLKA